MSSGFSGLYYMNCPTRWEGLGMTMATPVEVRHFLIKRLGFYSLSTDQIRLNSMINDVGMFKFPQPKFEIVIIAQIAVFYYPNGEKTTGLVIKQIKYIVSSVIRYFQPGTVRGPERSRAD